MSTVKDTVYRNLYLLEVSDIVERFLELLNGGLGFGLLLLTLILIRDYKKDFQSKPLKFQMIAALFVLSIILFSIKELYEYGPFEFTVNPVIVELLETSFLVLIITAAFILLGLRK